MATKRKRYTAKQAGKRHGWRSGLEETVAAQLDALGVAYEYEKKTIEYIVPESKHKYTPDFVILANGIVVETKGMFLLNDRKKHLLIKKQHPDIEIRFVFSNSRQKISKVSKTTYAKWCEQHGFLWADKTIPQEWLDEPRKNK